MYVDDTAQIYWAFNIATQEKDLIQQVQQETKYWVMFIQATGVALKKGEMYYILCVGLMKEKLK